MMKTAKRPHLATLTTLVTIICYCTTGVGRIMETEVLFDRISDKIIYS